MAAQTQSSRFRTKHRYEHGVYLPLNACRQDGDVTVDPRWIWVHRDGVASCEATPVFERGALAVIRRVAENGSVQGFGKPPALASVARTPGQQLRVATALRRLLSGGAADNRARRPSSAAVSAAESQSVHVVPVVGPIR